MVKHTQTIQKPTNCLSAFDHIVGLALKGLRKNFWCRLLPLPCMMLKNSRTYFKHFAVFKLLDFSSMSVWPFVNIMYERVKNVKLVFPRLTLLVGGSHPEVLFLWSPFYTTKRTSFRIKIQIQQKIH